MKFVRYLIVLVVAVALGLLGSLVKPADEAAFAQGQVGCTVTVRPGESIQAAIDRAPDGAVICLTEGTWGENIVIEKSVTLRGAGQERTVIRGVKVGYPVIWIWEPREQVLVQLEGLRITGAEGECAREWDVCPWGIVVWDSAQVTISGCTISENEAAILLLGSAQATISDSTISGNGGGILLLGSAQATISNCIISENRPCGIELMDSAQATISNSTISGNNDGIYIHYCKSKGSCSVSIFNSTISGNRLHGIYVLYDAPFTQMIISGSTISKNGSIPRCECWPCLVCGYGAGIFFDVGQSLSISNSTISENLGPGLDLDVQQVTISNSTISKNKFDGIVLREGQLTLNGSTVEGNGTYPDCAKADWTCNGLTVWYGAQATIIDSKIINNTDWGVALFVKRCGVHYYGDIGGYVEFQGTNVIAGNNTSGNQWGNPGWSGAPMPDGQVCLSSW